MRQAPSRRQEPCGDVFCIKTRLKCVPGDCQIVLLHRQRLTRRHAQLPFDQIHACDRFGHRVLDLKAGIHLHKPKTIRSQTTRAINYEFNRASTFV